MILNDNNGTICAISTPHGIGGIAVMRVSGSRAIAAVDSLWRGKPLDGVPSHTAHLGTVLDSQGHPLDQCVATVFKAPRSYTGDDTVELSVHGSRYIQQELLRALATAGVRLAEPGEFTRRAFAAGHLDLTQAEGVADMIAARSRASHRMAINQLNGAVSRRLKSLRDNLLELASLLELELDFAEEHVEFASRPKLLSLANEVNAEVKRLHDTYDSGRALREGIPVAIIGPTNAGKSSLLNALVGDERAIVSDIHGTTRDTIEETLNIGDCQFRFIDTAGLRDTDDEIERLGIERSRRALETSMVVILVFDVTQPVDHDMVKMALETVANGTAHKHLIIVRNKTDLLADGSTPAAATEQYRDQYPAVNIRELNLSAQRDITPLEETLSEIGDSTLETHTGDVTITNARHAQALKEAMTSMNDTIESLQRGDSGELTAQPLRQTIGYLSEIIGDIPAPTILNTIFSRFCIGK